MTVQDYIRDKVFVSLGLVPYGGPAQDEIDTFVNDRNSVRALMTREYNVWYSGTDSEILNFYTKQEMIDYAYEPFYWRNKDCYFWAVASTENDIKRTHVGIARDIVDTMVAIIGIPGASVNVENLEPNVVQSNLDDILTATNFWKKYQSEQMPLTFVEGWGCWKIGWDKSLSAYPIAEYYRADDVDFIVKRGFIIGVIFKDWYQDAKGNRWLVCESRYRKDGNVIIETEAFSVTQGDSSIINKIDLSDCPFMKGVEKKLIINDFDDLLATPCIFFEDTTGFAYGRSIYADRLSRFDDLDQCASQDANAVRSSSVQKTVDVNYLERDPKTHLPKQPKVFDLKFISVRGQKDADGSPLNGNGPMSVIQPQINFAAFSADEMQIVLDIIQGYMSPATLGIDIAKKDNADAQREKEKVTIFTRNSIIAEESRILSSVLGELLVAKEYMDKGKITVKHYNVSIKFPKFADTSFENKLKVLGDAYANDNLSTEEYVEELYGDELSKTRKEALKKYLDERHSAEGGGGGNQPPLPEDGNNGDAISSEMAKELEDKG